MNKTSKYAIVIGVLLVLNLWLFLRDQTKTKITYDVEVFQITPSLVDAVVISDPNGEKRISLKQSSPELGWMLEEGFSADLGLIQTFLTVFERVEVSKSIGDFDETEGTVTLYSQGKELLAVDFAANSNRTKSYFVKDGTAFQVSVPGYQSNIVDLFLLHPDQWENRLLIDASWRTIQILEIDQPGNSKIQIQFDEKFFLVNNEPVQDSSAVVDYLNQFQSFQANEIISRGRVAEVDSLTNLEPIAILTIDELNRKEPYTFQVFPRLPNRPFFPVKNDQGKYMVIDEKRILSILDTSPLL